MFHLFGMQFLHFGHFICFPPFENKIFIRSFLYNLQTLVGYSRTVSVSSISNVAFICRKEIDKQYQGRRNDDMRKEHPPTQRQFAQLEYLVLYKFMAYCITSKHQRRHWLDRLEEHANWNYDEHENSQHATKSR